MSKLRWRSSGLMFIFFGSMAIAGPILDSLIMGTGIEFIAMLVGAIFVGLGLYLYSAHE